MAIAPNLYGKEYHAHIYIQHAHGVRASLRARGARGPRARARRRAPPPVRAAARTAHPIYVLVLRYQRQYGSLSPSTGAVLLPVGVLLLMLQLLVFLSTCSWCQLS